MPDNTTPLLRTLSPALRGLERNLRGWIDGPHRYPLGTIQRATMEGLATDLRRQADALDVDRPMLVIVLMGGTGVGKSTLLNALAGGAIAQSGIMRPTTRDPVIYYHESIRHDRLDPVLRQCKLVPHDRPALEQKIIVDTPDLDSTELANRDKLLHIMPLADIVLYVGSQEKYHDELGWQLFLHQRKRRAFAFVLNKWDRCLHGAGSGLRPDQDLLRDLQAQGFQNPRLFRTCSNLWAASREREQPEDGTARGKPADLPEGEQFEELTNWLELGLTRLEIEAIKARGVSQMLVHLEHELDDIKPPDLSERAERTQAVWQKPLDEEATTMTEVLLNTLEPYQREIELHFALEGQRRFRGLMGTYLGLVTRFKYAGQNLRDRFSILPRFTSRWPGPETGPQQRGATPWDLSLFTRACSDAAAARQMDARGKALANRLLVEADKQGFPVELLNEPVEKAARLDWRARHAQNLSDVLQQVEQQWTRPTGGRRFVHALVIFLTDWVPIAALLAALLYLLWRYFDPFKQELKVSLSDIFLPFMVLLLVLIILHVLIALLMPIRWANIRGEFQKQLGKRLEQELETTYLPIPGAVVKALLVERAQVDKLSAETREVATWLEQREQASSITGLYGD